MDKVYRFHKISSVLFLCILLIEILISKTSGFIRHTIGDYVVVILLYYLVKSVCNIKAIKLGIYILAFAYLVECLQLINFVNLIGLTQNKTANIIIGNTFSIGDLVAYTLGIITVLFIENKD